MNTVARLCGGEDSDILQQLCTRIADVFPEFLHAGEGPPRTTFPGLLRSGDDWDERLSQMQQFLGKCGPVIAEAGRRGITIEIDTAMQPSDFADSQMNELELPLALMKRMSRLGVAFVLTVHGGK